MPGYISSIRNTLTVTNGAYTIGDVVGGLITFSGAVRQNGAYALISSVKLSGVAAIAYNLFFLNADLATPAADNAAFAWAAADTAKYLGHVQIAATDYLADQTAGFNSATVRNVCLTVKAAATTQSIYAYLVATAVTSPGTTTIYLTVDFWPDE
jgi:hypothetical protein